MQSQIDIENGWLCFQADKLSSWLGIDVDEDQVVMSHSPLKMFRDYHDKHVLVIGQGPVDDIARALGFRKVTTIQQLRHAFPTLDNVDHKRRRGKTPYVTENTINHGYQCDLCLCMWGK